MPARKPVSHTATVTCLGTGDGWPCADRNHSSFLYEFGSETFLIDCGESVSRSLTALKFDWNRLDAIVLSHTHSDHLGGLFMLLQGLWLEGRSRDLTIYLPGHVIAPLRELLKHMYLFDELFGFKFHFSPLHAGRQVKIGGVRLLPYLTSHLDGLQRAFGSRNRRVAFESFSFVIEGGGRRIVHSADLGVPEDLLPLLQKPTDLLVCELAHFTPQDLFSCLRGHAVKQAAFVHVARHLRRRLGPLKGQAAQRLPAIKCQFPKDGETLKA